jgi:hypothetical protein
LRKRPTLADRLIPTATSDAQCEPSKSFGAKL